jgi:type IV secretion system protein VirD4
MRRALRNITSTPVGAREDHDHWEATSKAFLTMGLLYEVYTRPQPTMTHITSFWSQPGVEPFALLGYVARHAPAAIAELAQEVLNKTAREASSVLSSMMKELFLYHDPTIAANTSCRDFLLEDFLRQDRWVSLYLVQSPGEEAYVRPFMRAFLRLALQRWLEIGDTKHDITQLLDEFPSFGRIDFLLANLAYLGGRGIRTVLGIQNIPQLRHTWGDADVIIEQCKIRLYYAANGETTGREISRQTGTGTATTVQESRRADGMSWLVPDSRTHQAQQHARSLLTDGEATQIHPTKGVLQVTGSDPIWVTKLRYWRHPTWLRRSRMLLPPMYRRPYGS